MKLITHQRITRFAATPKGADPLIIWLDRLLELQIHRGDRLADVAAVARKRYHLSPLEARKLAAYWFTIGERHLAGQHGIPWPPDAGRRNASGRRYGRSAARQ